MPKSPRELAYHILLNAEKDNSRYIDDILGETFAQHHLNQQDKAWIMELVYGSTRMQLQLDTIIASVFKGNYRKAQHAIKTLLRMGAFQILHMHVAEYAAINETVGLTRKVGQAQASALVNAILRKIQQSHPEKDLYNKMSGPQQLAVKRSHPQWLIQRWIDTYGEQETDLLCAYNNRTPDTWIRRNAARIDREQFENLLKRTGTHYERSTILEQFYQVQSAAALIGSEEFGDGWFSFQDIAAGMVAALVQPESGDTILDACAAPGGKMTFIAESNGENIGHLYAADASRSRLERVSEAIERLKLGNITITQSDAARDELPATDWVLIDVPCSGTGVMNRRPDARWKKEASDIESLTAIQANILNNTWKHLKVGGRMIYATCSLEPEENWKIIDSKLKSTENMELMPIKDEKLQAYVDERGALSTLPWRDHMDGMFAVLLRKVS